MITSDERCAREIKSSVAKDKNNMRQEVGSFHQQIGLKCKEGTNKLLHLGYGLCMVLKLGHFGK
jgi:hypothetical protein